MDEKREENKNFRTGSIVLIIVQGILITLSIIAYFFKDKNIGINNFSMFKLYLFVLTFTIIFGIFVVGYILGGLFLYDIVKTESVKKINYKTLMVLFLIMIIIGATAFFTQLYLVHGQLTELTWGSVIFGVLGLLIFCITFIIGIFWAIEAFRSL